MSLEVLWVDKDDPLLDTIEAVCSFDVQNRQMKLDAKTFQSGMLHVRATQKTHALMISSRRSEKTLNLLHCALRMVVLIILLPCVPFPLIWILQFYLP